MAMMLGGGHPADEPSFEETEREHLGVQSRPRQGATANEIHPTAPKAPETVGRPRLSRLCGVAQRSRTAPKDLQMAKVGVQCSASLEKLTSGDREGVFQLLRPAGVNGPCDWWRDAAPGESLPSASAL